MSDTPGPVTAYNTSPAGQLLNAVVEAIIDLDLPDIGGNVWVRTPPTLKGINTLPAIVVSIFPGAHTPTDGTLTAPDVFIRHAIAFVYAGEREVNEATPEMLYVEHALMLWFAKNADAVSVTLVDGVHYLYTNVSLGDPRIIEKWRETINAGFLFVEHRIRYPSTA